MELADQGDDLVDGDDVGDGGSYGGDWLVKGDV